MNLQSYYQNEGEAYLNMGPHVFSLYKILLNKGKMEIMKDQ
jgi:hypothetical protein